MQTADAKAMTAETDLLPLPEEECMGGNDVYGVEYPLYTSDHMQSYARACVADLQREVEGLRAEVAKQSAYAKRTHDWNTELLANNERLAEALRAAERSLRTIADGAGRAEFLEDTGDVRGYANSRANAALAALHPTAAQENDDA